ncbi:hypothetical protein LEP1GSC005_3993 [Leptospira santarosai str. ST188]|uniref:Uncharacterized protein n=1 Tax=Leptospira santarosai serovar Arenal str. MAVJ 401 TaxID=1049976 RepID=M6JKR7_9LEPT|nr:hypothetical protein LEP1GSC005_3993 [Leptospira santarosai str. ST188]EMM77728.1 hypothetical protein LEP1GSC040_0776 [Leptospira santarosai str. 2000030832]EMN22311.1 hypothetical protein LEP1GSC063_0089 [Leptospira santarosai serovar Arenal str. MAVJ 401]
MDVGKFSLSRSFNESQTSGKTKRMKKTTLIERTNVFYSKKDG